MNKIFLVCTRSAISGSALTYVINSSPDFYNLSHNNLWMEEVSDKFGTAHIINDWWNISDDFKRETGYDEVIRNTEALDDDEIIRLGLGFKELDLGKNICIFTHARNLEEIQNCINEQNLPITTVSTIIGNNSHYFVNSWIRREYNRQMNEYLDVFDSWKYLYTQRIYNDSMWAQHVDHTLTMYDWLKQPHIVYEKLGIAPNKHMKVWTDQYLLRNDSLYMEHDLENINFYEGAKYKLTILLHMYDQLNHLMESDIGKVKLCCKLFSALNNQNFTTVDDIKSHVQESFYLQ